MSLHSCYGYLPHNTERFILPPKMQNRNGLMKCHGVQLANQSLTKPMVGLLTSINTSVPSQALAFSWKLAQIHFLTDVPDPMTKTWIFLPF